MHTEMNRGAYIYCSVCANIYIRLFATWQAQPYFLKRRDRPPADFVLWLYINSSTVPIVYLCNHSNPTLFFHIATVIIRRQNKKALNVCEHKSDNRSSPTKWAFFPITCGIYHNKTCHTNSCNTISKTYCAKKTTQVAISLFLLV